MTTHDTIVIGASAGGVQALAEVVKRSSRGLTRGCFIVLHISPDGPGLLPRILARESKLSVKHPHDGELIRRGHIYVAPPDHHLLIEKQHVRLVHGPKENLPKNSKLQTKSYRRRTKSSKPTTKSCKRRTKSCKQPTMN